MEKEIYIAVIHIVAELQIVMIDDTVLSRIAVTSDAEFCLETTLLKNNTCNTVAFFHFKRVASGFKWKFGLFSIPDFQGWKLPNPRCLIWQFFLSLTGRLGLHGQREEASTCKGGPCSKEEREEGRKLNMWTGTGSRTRGIRFRKHALIHYSIKAPAAGFRIF